MESPLFRAKGREEVEHRQVLMKSFGSARSLESGNITGELNFKSRVLSFMMLKSRTCLASVSRELAVSAGGQLLRLQGREQALGSRARHTGLASPSSVQWLRDFGRVACYLQVSVPSFVICE